MTNTNITSFRENVISMMEQAVKYNEPVNISTENGNAVLMSESDYKDIMATLEIYNNPVLHNKILKGLDTDLSDCVPEEDVEW